MDKEKKMGLKRKCKPTEKANTNDDEPIGALLKLKGKRNSKKSKVLADGGADKVKGVVKMPSEDAELGGMDDTLAIFRKKLRGPKKNVGSAVSVGKELSSNAVEPSFPSLNESVKDPELDPNGINRAHKRCLEKTEGGSPGDETVIDGLKSKPKMRNNSNKRSKVKSCTKKIGNSVLDDISDHKISPKDELKREKEYALESEGEDLDDSLSAFFQKVQSGITGKFRTFSRLKQEKETQVSDDGMKPDSATGSESPTGNSKSDMTLLKKSLMNYGNRHQASGQGSMNSALICQSLDDCLPEALKCTEEKPTNSNKGISIDLILENSGSTPMVKISPSNLRTCAGMDIGVGDGKSNYNSIDLKLDKRIDTDLESKYSGKVQKEHSSGDHGGSFNILIERSKHLEPGSPQEMENQVPECKPSPASDSKSLVYEVVMQKLKDESKKVAIEPEHISGYSHALGEGACLPNSDYPSEDEEVKDTNSPSLLENQGSSAEYRGSVIDPETKVNSLSLGQRAVRNARKQRHGDMSYEGDIDWEILMQAPEYFVQLQSLDKTKSKFNSSSTGVHSGNGKAAAVAAGLKARAAGPLEKIRFKEVLKLKGGFQEYLECRNHVLSVWNKDVTRILQLADFGVSGVPLVGESARASLIRDIFTFLDQCGYINFGVPSEKELVEKCFKHEDKLLTEEKFEDNSALPVADSEDGGSYILVKDNNSVETCVRKSNDSFVEEILAGKVDTEDGLTNLEALESSAPSVPAGDTGDDIQGIYPLESIPLDESDGSKFLDSIHSFKNENGIAIPGVQTLLRNPDEAVCGIQTKCAEYMSGNSPDATNCSFSHTQCDSGPRKNIIVVGAGPAGLTAARHLQRQGFTVTVIEARNRIGGRVFTDHHGYHDAKSR